MKKRLLSLLLCLAMVVTLLPTVGTLTQAATVLTTPTPNVGLTYDGKAHALVDQAKINALQSKNYTITISTVGEKDFGGSSLKTKLEAAIKAAGYDDKVYNVDSIYNVTDAGWYIFELVLGSDAYSYAWTEDRNWDAGQSGSNCTELWDYLYGGKAAYPQEQKSFIDKLYNRGYIYGGGYYSTTSGKETSYRIVAYYAVYIAPAKMNVPEYQQHFIYDGAKHSPLSANEDQYILSGVTSAVAAGSYDLSITPTYNYVWADAPTTDNTSCRGTRSYKWYIDNDTIDVDSLGNGTEFVYDGEMKSPLEITEDSPYFVDNSNGKEDTVEAEDVGDYTFYLLPKDGFTWSDGTKTAKKVTWSITPATVKLPTVNTGLTYKTDDYGTAILQTGIEVPTDALYKVSSTKGDPNKQEEVGDYETIIHLNDKNNYVWEDGISTLDSSDIYLDANNYVHMKWSIAKAKVDVPTAAEDLVYQYDKDGNALVQVGIVYVPGEFYDEDLTKITLNNPLYVALDNDPTDDADDTDIGDAWYQSDAGTYTTWFQLADPDSYEWATDKVLANPALYSVEWEIAEPDAVKVPNAVTGLVYNGEKQAGIKNFKEDLYEVASVTRDGKVIADYYDYRLKLAGYYVVELQLRDENYSWAGKDGKPTKDNQFVTFTIAKATVEVPTAAEGLVYNGTMQNGLVNYDENSTIYTLSVGDNIHVKAGTYSVTFTLEDPDNYAWNTGDSKDKTVTFTIAKATVAVPSAATGLVYDGTLKNGIVGFDESLYYCTDVSYQQTDAGTYEVKLALWDTLNYAWDTGDSTNKTVTFTIAKATVAVPTAAEGLVYTGTMQCGLINYDESAGIYYADQASRKNAGDWTVTLTLDDPNYCWLLADGTTSTENQKINFTIAKCSVKLPINPAAVANDNGVYELEETTGCATQWMVSSLSDAVSIDYDGDEQNIKGSIAGDEGSFVLSLQDSNYQWEDGTTEDKPISWVIVHNTEVRVNGTKHQNYCTICGEFVGEAEDHVCDGTWIVDEETGEHYHVCYVCGASYAHEEHTYISNGEGKHVCSICGKEENCVASDVLGRSEEGHWQKCAVCGALIGEIEEHTFENGSHVCSVCGFKKAEYKLIINYVDADGEVIATKTDDTQYAKGDAYDVGDKYAALTHYTIDEENLPVTSGTFEDADITLTYKVALAPCKEVTTYTWTQDETTKEWSCTATHVCTLVEKAGDTCIAGTKVETETATVDNKQITTGTTATCLKDGVDFVKATFKATWAAAQEKTTEREALGHEWDKDAQGNYRYTVDTPATETTVGTMSVHCTRCGAHHEELKTTFTATSAGALVRIVDTPIPVNVTISGNTAEAEIDADTVPTTSAYLDVPVSSLSIAKGVDTVTIPYAELAKVLNYDKDKKAFTSAKIGGLCVSMNNGTVMMGADELVTLANKLKEGEKLTIAIVVPTLNKAQKAVVDVLSNAKVYSVVVKCGDTVVENTTSSSVTVSLPYTEDTSAGLNAALLSDAAKMSTMTFNYTQKVVTMAVKFYDDYVLYTNEVVVEPSDDPIITMPFTDVNGSYAYDYILKAYEMGLVKGKTATKFAPKDNLKISEAIKLAACMYQYFTEGKVTLTESTSGAWYQNYLNYAVSKGIVTAVQFAGRYNQYATRAEYVTIFAKALPASEYAAINTIADDAIPDVKVSDSYGPAVYKLYRAGILTGYGDGSFHPASKITRDEVCAVVARMMDKGSRVSFTIA